MSSAPDPALPAFEARRKQDIADRERLSTGWRLVHKLGSLRLAVILLVTIALAIGLATVMESRFTTQVAQHYIYRAPWFTGWLLVLCVNLLCAALSRWPWLPKHYGFVITHMGIITLLIGAIVGRYWGYEAFVTLRKGEPPANRVITQETVLTVQDADSGIVYRIPFSTRISPPSQDKPRILPLPEGRYELLIDDHSDRLGQTARIEPSFQLNAPAAVALEFTSAAMKQKFEVNLLSAPPSARAFDFFGLARAELVDDLRPGHQPPLTTPEGKLWREAHLIFAQHPDQPIITTELSRPSGYSAQLLNASRADKVRLVVEAPREAKAFYLPDTPLEKTIVSKIEYPLSQTRKLLPAPGKNKVSFQVKEFWPDFVMRDNKPATLSQEPRNPAALVEFSGEQAPSPVRPLLRVALAASGKLRYQLSRGSQITTDGIVAKGDVFSLGWADWQARVVEALPHADLRRQVAPVQEPVVNADSIAPGIRVRLRGPDGKLGEPAWIMSGQAQYLALDNFTTRIGYGLRPVPIPFTVELKNFEVPRDEGTDTPSDFIATVLFRDGVSERLDTAHMNSPAVFPGGFWRSALGLNYKFSQASWNPQDLSETTLQVLYDPGWPFKWVGSLMICGGIATMFYLKPRKKIP